MPEQCPNDVPTPREMQVLRLICDGMSGKQIAAKLGVTFKTVATHRRSLMDKAGATNVVMLFRWALKRRYTSVD